MKWLHLTDLHFSPWQDGRSTNELKDMLIPYLRNHRITADYLFLTGDYRHAKYQCASIEDTARDAAQFILQIAEAAQIPASNIHIVPGNHDLNRTANTERLANIVTKYDVYDGRFETDDLIFLLERFPFFYCLCEELKHKGATSCCPGTYLSAPHPYYCYDDFSLLCLNTCMVCNADKDRGALLVGNYYIWQALEAIKKIQSDKPIIILAHHALNLLREDERWEMEKLFAKYPVRLYLCGDSHVLRRRTINDLTEITSGCLIQGRDIQACFPVGTMANGSFSLEVHSWDAPMSNWGSYTHFNQKYMSNCTTSIVTKGQPVLPSPYFMGRDAKIEEIEEVILTGSKHVMLCGMGGIGKTEICRQLFQKYLYETDSDSISHLGWICYQSALKDSFVGHFPEINSTDMDGYWLSTEHFIQNLGPKLLLFIDNADPITQQELLMLEKLNCRIILTSRAKSDQIKTIDISSLSPEDCLALYRFHSMEDSNDNESIHTIISLVAYHTLFVELLAKIQYAAGLSAKELLQKLQQRKFDLSDIKENISYLHNPEINHDQKWSRQFMEHVNILFDISEVNDKPEEFRILQLFSLLAPGILVSVHIIKSWFMLKDLNAINSLAHKGWLERGSQNGIPSFTIHPLVSAAIRSTAKFPQELLVALTQNMENDLLIKGNETFLDKLNHLPHAESIANHTTCANINLAKLQGMIGAVHLQKGDTTQALKYYEETLEIQRKILGESHPDIAKSYNAIAAVYDMQGKYAEALNYCMLALDINKETLGNAHTDTAMTCCNISSIYLKMNDHDKASQWIQKALTIQSSIEANGTLDKKEAENRAAIYLAAGNTCCVQAQLDDANSWYKKSLAIYENLRGKEAADTATVRGNIARIYHIQGNYDKALEEYLTILKMQENGWGKDHLNTSSTYRNIGNVYRSLKDYSSAAIWYDKARKIRETPPWKEHRLTANIYNDIGMNYWYQKDYKNAREYCEKALHMYEKILGPNDLNTKLVCRNLALICLMQGKLFLAWKYYQRSVG